MISLHQIVEEYPPQLRGHRESILKEYLQYKILQSIYDTKYADSLVFLGGTALRILHGNTRFSEDLDFDNLGLTSAQFHDLSGSIKKTLELEGLQVEIDVKTQQAYRIKIKIPKILYESGLAPISDQKILIQIDTVPQNFDYQPDSPLLNKFEVFTQIKAVPKDILLAQKLYACLHRPRIMGRDFFDIVFLYGIGAQPNYRYLKRNIKVSDKPALKAYLLKNTKDLHFEQLAQDVQPFLFNPRDSMKITLFREFVEEKL
jgi:predicted nucleotidyltransferase component of viral defense system